MDGYTVSEAASVLGVSTERVWELLARGVLAGTPEGPSGGGMRIYLQPRPGPIATTAEPDDGGTARSRGPNGHDGELSPFRELLTEFRSLTERYGQALLALGEARGEVASLRSRVELLEARIDVRLPPVQAPQRRAAWDVTEPVEAARPVEVPEPAEPAGEPAQETAGAAAEAETEEQLAAVVSPSMPEPAEAAVQAAPGKRTTKPAKPAKPARRRGRGETRHRAGLAEALARAEDPTLAGLPGGREAADALAAFQHAAAAPEAPADELVVGPALDEVAASEPWEPAPADELPIAEEPTAGEAIAAPPSAEAPVVEGVIATEPISGQAIAEEPIAEEPITAEPTAEAVMAEEAAAAWDWAEVEAVGVAGESEEIEPTASTAEDEIPGEPLAPDSPYTASLAEPDWFSDADLPAAGDQGYPVDGWQADTEAAAPAWEAPTSEPPTASAGGPEGETSAPQGEPAEPTQPMGESEAQLSDGMAETPAQDSEFAAEGSEVASERSDVAAEPTGMMAEAAAPDEPPDVLERPAAASGWSEEFAEPGAEAHEPPAQAPEWTAEAPEWEAQAPDAPGTPEAWESEPQATDRMQAAEPLELEAPNMVMEPPQAAAAPEAMESPWAAEAPEAMESPWAGAAPEAMEPPEAVEGIGHGPEVVTARDEVMIDEAPPYGDAFWDYAEEPFAAEAQATVQREVPEQASDAGNPATVETPSEAPVAEASAPVEQDSAPPIEEEVMWLGSVDEPPEYAEEMEMATGTWHEPAAGAQPGRDAGGGAPEVAGTDSGVGAPGTAPGEPAAPATEASLPDDIYVEGWRPDVQPGPVASSAQPSAPAQSSPEPAGSGASPPPVSRSPELDEGLAALDALARMAGARRPLQRQPGAEHEGPLTGDEIVQRLRAEMAARSESGKGGPGPQPRPLPPPPPSSEQPGDQHSPAARAYRRLRRIFPG